MLDTIKYISDEYYIKVIKTETFNIFCDIKLNSNYDISGHTYNLHKHAMLR